MEGFQSLISNLVEGIPAICSDSYTFSLGDLGLSFYPEVEGTYLKVCEKSNQWPVYQKVDTALYIHFVTDESNYAFWIVSEKLSSYGTTPLFIKPVPMDGVCPGSYGSASWYIYQVTSDGSNISYFTLSNCCIFFRMDLYFEIVIQPFSTVFNSKRNQHTIYNIYSAHFASDIM